MTESERREDGWEELLSQIEQDAGWLHDHVPDYSPDGVATLRDIARTIVQTAHQLRAVRQEPAIDVERPPDLYAAIQVVRAYLGIATPEQIVQEEARRLAALRGSE